METRNVFTNLSISMPKELTEVIAGNQNARIERIVSHGQTSPEGFWYDQDEDEWVIVLKGEAKLQFEDDKEPLHLKCGDHVLIEAHQKHRVEWTTPAEPTVWLAVFFNADKE